MREVQNDVCAKTRNHLVTKGKKVYYKARKVLKKER